ncbi:MBL fold metallo-hydrolase [Amycolatopsis sp. NPDC059657]|uniref:MBL fold metallo-hydrolase n=1 Tax=Amycolatopsis sp. NPDC059657 TaxID=3346899 RepID=UPI00366CAE1A
MRLTILGCAGSIPGPDTAASGYLIEADGFVLGLELGNGTLARLQALRDPFDLDALVLSHLHPDHCADFSALTVLRRYHPEAALRTNGKLPVYAPNGAHHRLANAYAPDEDERAITDLSDTYQFHGLLEETVEIGPFEVTAVPVDHPTPAFGFRVCHGGRSLAYTGDTGPCEALDKLVRDVDVLLAEASWTDSPVRPPGMHLSGKQAAEIALRGGVDRLLLTHVLPWTDSAAVLAEADAVFPRAELVQQGAVYDV